MRMHEKINSPGTTGRQLEREVFGQVKGEILVPEKLVTESVEEYRASLWEQLKKILGDRYIILYDKGTHEIDNKLLELLNANQPGSLSEDVLTLTLTVKEKLITKIPSLEKSNKIDIFFLTTVNTILDKIAGVDGLFVFNHEGNRAVVALDITQETAKEEYKADVIMKLSSGETEEDRYFSYKDLGKYADQIVDSLVRQLNIKKEASSKSMVAQENGGQRPTGGPRKKVEVVIKTRR